MADRGEARGSEPGPARWFFVAGEGRSGSTLLGSLLAQAAAGFDCGELHHLWEWSANDRLCTCGTKVADCTVWSAVVDSVKADMGFKSVQEVLSASEQRTRQRHLLAPWLRKPTEHELALRHATERAVETVTGATTFIDSSKVSGILWAAAHIDRPLTAVLLVRDPRAVAYSWSQPHRDPSLHGAFMMRKTTRKSAINWNVSNLTTLRAMRNLPNAGGVEVRYEDLVTDLNREIGRVVAESGDQVPSTEIHDPAPGSAVVSHAIAGNPRRFSPSTVKLDNRWQTAMPARSRLLCTVLTAPLLRRFGYAVVAQSSSERRRSVDDKSSEST